MTFKKANELATKFELKISDLEATRKRMDKLYKDKIIYTKDIEHVYEGIFLKAVTSFESYIENLFLGILYNQYKLPGKKKHTRVTFSSRQVTRDIVFGGQNYTDWMPFDKLKKKADIFYNEGKPFTVLNQQDKNSLAQIMSIRNAIAHKSPYSDKIFQKTVISSSIGLPEKNKTPAGFLRYVFRSQPDQTKFENYMIELVGITSKMATYS